LLVEDTVEVPAGDGKRAGRMSWRQGFRGHFFGNRGQGRSKVAEQLAAKNVVKVIAFAGKMVNFVANNEAQGRSGLARRIPASGGNHGVRATPFLST